MTGTKRQCSGSWLTVVVLAAASLLMAGRTLLGADEGAAAPATPAGETTESKSSGAATTATVETKSAEQPAASGGATAAPGGPGTKPGESPGKPGERPGKPGEPPKPGGKPGEPPGKPGEPPKPETGPKPVQRPDKPAKPPDPEQLKVRPDEAGKVRFNFTGQPWPGVLEWLAEVSGMSLDWQELPGDYLNLNTHRSYTVREARDTINRHLLARGYTILIRDEVMSVVGTKKLDPSLVPRVEPGELVRRDPYEFVKVAFALDWLVAESVAEELKPMLSPNGKLIALVASNRLEAMDAVINLRDIDALLRAEQSADSQERLVREFKLKFARAEEVRGQLQTLLGLESKPAVPGMPQGAPGNPEQAAQQQAMMMARMQQEGGGGGGGPKPPAGPPKPKPSVNLVVDQRKNSILVNAPPEKMAIIAQAVEALDVAPDHSRSLLANMSRMQVYRLAGIDPEPLVKTLEEMGNLDPTTRLQVDKKNKAIIAYASLADHVTIRAVVEKLSGSERQFEVIRLRRLPADYVAGTIEFMMGGGKKKDSQQSNRYYSPWYSPSREQTQENPNEFRVDADVEHNRLLLWANEVELSEVENLLVKLGEMPAKGEATTVRVIETPGLEATQELLERIRYAWPQVAPNPLEVPPAAAVEKPKSSAPSEKTPNEPAAPATSRSTSIERPRSVVRLAQLHADQSALEKPEPPADAPQAEPEPPAPLPRGKTARPANPPKSPAPLKVTIGPEGRLIVSCEDPQALDLFEEMVTQMAPARKNYKVFQLKYAWAYGVALNLQEFFKEDEKKSNRFSPFFFDYGYGQDDSQQERTRLSKRRPLKFISDPDTNTILVEGADAAQLKTIDELIKLYDQAAPTDSQSVRKTETVHLKYSKAKVVAETVKEVYRDLLSANDKALVGGKQTERESGRSFYYVFGDSDKSEQKTPKFKGLLSIGVDELSNTLVVSAPAFLFEQVHTMIEDLDKAAAPTTAVQVVRVGQGVSAEHVQEVLSDLLGTGSPNRRRAGPPPRRPQQPQQQMQGRGGQARQGNTQGSAQQPASSSQGR